MENRATTQNSQADSARSTQVLDLTPKIMAATAALFGLLMIVSTISFSNQSWMSALITALLILSPLALIPTGIVQNKERHPKQAIVDTRLQDELARKISWAPLHPKASGELRNCKVCRLSNNDQLQVKPVFTLQYAALIVAAVVFGCLLFTLLPDRMPWLFNSPSASIFDSTIKTFFYLFSFTTFICVACMLYKPARALQFNKINGVFWIEKFRVFGWKTGESAHMPIAQIHALQIINYSKRHTTTGSNDHPQSTSDFQSQVENNRRAARNTEVNVVFRNGERVNIINHCNRAAIARDTATLALFLNVPIWNKKPPVTTD